MNTNKTNSWACRFGLHDWSKWGEDTSFTRTVMTQTMLQDWVKGPQREVIRQSRTCKCCGKLQQHFVDP